MTSNYTYFHLEASNDSFKPIATTHHATLYSTIRNSLITYGGEDGDYLWCNQLSEYKFKENTWKELKADIVKPTKTIQFIQDYKHGNDEQDDDESPDHGEWFQLCSRDGHSMVSIESSSELEKFLVFGGATDVNDPTIERVQHQLAEIRIKSKGSIECEMITQPNAVDDHESIPEMRKFHTAIYNPKKKEMIVFGGRSLEEPCQFYNDLFTFDVVKRRWKRIYQNTQVAEDDYENDELSNVPCGRSGHSAVYDTQHNRMIIFGGFSKKERSNRNSDDNVEESTSNYRYIYYNDVYSLDLDTYEWYRLYTIPMTHQDDEEKQLPSGRERHTACIHKNEMFVFGGWTFGGISTKSNEFLYKLNLETNEWTNCGVETILNLNDPELTIAPNTLCRYGHSITLIPEKCLFEAGVKTTETMKAILFGGRICNDFYCNNELIVFNMAQNKALESLKLPQTISSKTASIMERKNQELEMAKKPKISVARRAPKKPTVDIDRAMKENVMRGVDTPNTPTSLEDPSPVKKEEVKKKPIGAKSMFGDANGGGGLNMNDVMAQRNRLKKTDKTVSEKDNWKSIFK